MIDYKTESESATPRLCLQFSESLSRGQVDFAKFVSVDGKDPQSVVVEGQQLCIEGLTHGERYEVNLRAGLPSDVDEDLQKPIEIAVYVPDRKPFVRFSGKSYVLPSRGQQGIPLVSVNTSKVAVEVYRIGDRSLVGTLESGDFQRQLSSYEVDTIKNRTGERVYAGEMDVPQKLNEEVTTALPVTDAIGTLKPGVYVAIAKPTQKSREELLHRGDAVVHRLRPRPHGLLRRRRRARVRALARRGQALGRRQGEARCAQQRGFGHRQVRRQRLCALRCGPDARRRRSAAGAARRRERQRRVCLPRSHLGRLRPDRPRRQGPRGSGSARRLPLHRARHLPPRRGGAHHGSGARLCRQGGEPAGHADRHAPRRRRVPPLHARRQGPRRPRADLGAAAVRHDRHLARQAAHRSAERSDHAGLVPGRRTSCPSASTSSSSRRQRRSRRARPQPSRLRAAISTDRRPRAWPSKATSSSSRRARMSPASRTSSSDRRTRASIPCASRSTRKRPRTPRATPTSP